MRGGGSFSGVYITGSIRSWLSNGKARNGTVVYLGVRALRPASCKLVRQLKTTAATTTATAATTSLFNSSKLKTWTESQRDKSAEAVR